MIIETILSTVDDDGVTHFAPMGLVWGERQIEILPYRSSRTFANLAAGRGAVANITDDVGLFVACSLVEAARRDRVHRLSRTVPGGILEEVCSYRELRLVDSVDEGARCRFFCGVVGSGRGREFLGFNRSAAAILEATVAVTRRAWIPKEQRLALLDRARLLTAKTGGEREALALRLLEKLVEEGCS